MKSLKIKLTNKDIIFFIISLMLFLFCFMKVLRGADTGSTQIGGIWNYISLFYYPIALYIILSRRFRIYPLFVCLIGYVLFALMAALVNFSGKLTINNIYSVLMIPYFSLVFYAFFVVSNQQNILCLKILLLTFYVCLLVNLYSIIKWQFMGAQRPLASDIYFSLTLFPFTLIVLNKKLLRFLTIFFMFVAVFFSGKRTGLISFVLSIICYYLLRGHIENNAKFIKQIKLVLTVIIMIALIGIISVIVDNIYNLGIYKRLLRLVDDGGSGRIDLYVTVLNAFCNAPLINKLFGHGVYASERITIIRAHNDFLEILYDYGIISLVLFIFFYLLLFWELVKMIKHASPYAPAYACSLIISFFLSMFSFYMTYYTYVTSGVAIMGYFLSCENKRVFDLRKNYEI